MKAMIRLLAIFAIIFFFVNYAFKILAWLGGASNKPSKTVHQNGNVTINMDEQPKVTANKGEYIDYEDLTDKE